MSLIPKQYEKFLEGHEYTVKLLCECIFDMDHSFQEVISSNISPTEQLKILMLIKEKTFKSAVFFQTRLLDKLVDRNKFIRDNNGDGVNA